VRCKERWCECFCVDALSAWCPQANQAGWAWDDALHTLRSLRSVRAGPGLSPTGRDRQTPDAQQRTSALLERLRSNRPGPMHDQLRLARLQGHEQVMERWERILHFRRRTRTWYASFLRWRRSARVHKRARALGTRYQRHIILHAFLLFRRLSIIMSSKRLRLVRTQRLIDIDREYVALTRWREYTARKRFFQLLCWRHSKKMSQFGLCNKAGRTFRAWQQHTKLACSVRTTSLRLELVLRPSWIRTVCWKKWRAATSEASDRRKKELKANIMLSRIFLARLTHVFLAWSGWSKRQRFATSASMRSMLRQDIDTIRACYRLWRCVVTEKAFRRLAKENARVVTWKACVCLVKIVRLWKHITYNSLRFRRLSGRAAIKVMHVSM